MILRFETIMAERLTGEQFTEERFTTAAWQCVDQVECKAGELESIIQDHIISPGFPCVEGMLFRVIAPDTSYKVFVYQESAFVHTTLHETWMSNESVADLYELASPHQNMCLRALLKMTKRAIKDSREFTWLNQAMDAAENFIQGNITVEALQQHARDLSQNTRYTDREHPDVSLIQLANIASLGPLLLRSHDDLTAGENAITLIFAIYRRFHKKKNVAQSEKALCDLLRQEIPFHIVLRSHLDPVIVE